jgi:hypothetical protein
MQRTNADADQPVHRMPQHRCHTPDLPLAPFSQDNPQPGIPFFAS